MTSPVELERFLAALGVRRERLLELVPTIEDADRAELIEELTELGEQLIVAEEELRVQQEELTAAREQLARLAHERESLFQSAAAYVLTDDRGVVLRANRAAQQLILQPRARITPRPIATWFELADRPTVRTLINALAAGRQPAGQARAVIRRPDRTTVEVAITVTAAADQETGRTVLQWELATAEPAASSPTLRLVTDPVNPPPPEQRLVAELAAVATELAEATSEQQLLDTLATRATELIPAADGFGILLLGRRSALYPAAWSSDAALACDQVQADAGQGPALAALERHSTVLVDRIADEEARWPAFVPQAATFDQHSVLSAVLGDGAPALGVLTGYSGRPTAFDESARFVISMLAMHAGIALRHVRLEQNLRYGMASREIIGEAVGVLIERRRITSAEAFRLLVRASQHTNIKLREVARIVVETGQDPAQIRLR